MPRASNTPPPRSKLTSLLMAVLIAALVVEIGGRCFYYHRGPVDSFALVQMFRDAQGWRRDQTIRSALDDLNAAAAAGGERAQHAARYGLIFARFVELCRLADAKLVVLYIPGPSGHDAVAHGLFSRLSSEHDVPFLDATTELARFPVEVAYLMPEDGHLSRFGSHVVAGALLAFLEPWRSHRSAVSHDDRPALLGDLEPSANYVFWEGAPLPCRVITNSQGLRREADLEFPRPVRTRVLCIGDSYTFGASLHNPQCFPQVLERTDPELEVINAGISGYTICDEYSYFEERGRFTEPDIVVLQVFPNDLDGFEPELQRTFCRGGEFCPARGEQRR